MSVFLNINNLSGYSSGISIAVVDKIPCMDMPILFTVSVTAMG
jgi:hypothetical protein